MTPNYTMIGIKLLGSLGLLIYGMRMMSEALQKMTGPQLRHIMGRMTQNRLSAMLTGAFVTCAVQSSSATTVMTVSFVSAGLFTLSQAIAVIMGANIGTTLTAWIMSLGYSVDLSAVVFPAFLVGMMLIYKKRHRYVGDFLFGIAFMFLSLVMLSASGKELDLEHNQELIEFFGSFNTSSYWTILAFLAIGTLITCIVQSSAAVMAITIMLCSTGVLPIYLGIALVMGENIGTTATANLAALGSGTEARRAALAHLLFNVFGVIWVLCVFYPFVGTVCRLAGYDPEAGGQASRLPVVLAMFHTGFNVANTALLLGFVPQIERIVCWLMPGKKEPEPETFRLRYIQANLMQTPEIAILQAQKETLLFARRTQDMFAMVGQLLHQTDDAAFETLYKEIAHQEVITDQMEDAIARFLEDVGRDHLSDDSKARVRQIMRQLCELESIGDACLKLARTLHRHHELGQLFTPEQLDHIHTMMGLSSQALAQMNDALTSPRSPKLLEDAYHLEEQTNTLARQLRAENITAINDRRYDYALGTLYADIISECEALGNYVINVVEARHRHHAALG